MKTKLSVVIPCYNEKSRLEEGFEHVYKYLFTQKYNWEILFVNDGSSDNTLNLMKKFAAKYKNIKVISYSHNRGKGFAIVQGVKNASGDYILFTDIDHSVPIETIEKFFNHFQKDFDIVIGSRRVDGAVITKHQNLIRETLGKGFTFLVNLLIDAGIKDATCGFKAFKNSTAQKIFSKITIYDWAFDAELIYICKKYKIKIAQAPVTWTDVKGSKVSITKDIANSLKDLFKIRINDLKGIYN